jgi:hypothetical protein
MEDVKPDYGLGRVPSVDFRDRKFLAKVPKRLPATRTNRSWITAKPLDQGDKPECVAYAWEQYLLSAPVKNKYYKDPDKLYNEAQIADEWPGEDYDGTSVRAGAKVLQDAGYIKEYNWAFDIETVVNYLLSTGPVVMGTNWDNAMFYPFEFGKDKQQFIRRGGGNAGGHAYVLKGVNIKRACWCGTPGVARIINSWSASWGDGGKVWICLKELDTLIKEFGEACMATELKFKVQT